MSPLAAPRAGVSVILRRRGNVETGAAAALDRVKSFFNVAKFNADSVVEEN